MPIGLLKQREFLVLLSIVDLGGSGREKDVLDNIASNEYYSFLEADLTPVEARAEEPRWRMQMAWDSNRLSGRGYIVKGGKPSVWTITEKGMRYLRELCVGALELSAEVDHVLYSNASSRAREILGENEQNLRQIEKELSDDYTDIAGGDQEEAVKEIPKYIPEYQRVVDDLKEKYGNKCQIDGCGFTFRKRSGGFYSEGHHLVWRVEGGGPEPSNVVILCPNHHRMLHYASVEIGERKEKSRELKINGDSYFIVY